VWHVNNLSSFYLFLFYATYFLFEMKIYFCWCHPFSGAVLRSINVKVYEISPFFISSTKLARTTGVREWGGVAQLTNPTDILQHVALF
jgi:hypothetical protein